MGCNSHLSIFYRPWKDSNYWTEYAKDVAESRDYLLYAFMADVRNSFDVKPVAEQRGIIDEDFKKWFEDYGGHSASWLSPDEFLKACELTSQSRKEARGGDEKYKNDPLLDKTWVILRNLLDDLKQNYGNENVRLCFFFDN